MKTKTIYGVTMLCAMMLASCRGDEGADRAPTIYNIVELADMDAGQTAFALYSQDSATPTMLRCRGEVIDTTVVHVGNALYLAYQPVGDADGKSVEIITVGYSRVNNISLKQTDAAGLAGWADDPVDVVSVWRAGTQVYMRLRLPYDEAPRLFSLLVDKSTIHAPMPDAYLYHGREQSAPTFMRQYYAAVQLKNLWSRPETEGLRIHISTGDAERVFIIERP